MPSAVSSPALPFRHTDCTGLGWDNSGKWLGGLQRSALRFSTGFQGCVVSTRLGYGGLASLRPILARGHATSSSHRALFKLLSQFSRVEVVNL
jgi:hypothetical protein